MARKYQRMPAKWAAGKMRDAKWLIIASVYACMRVCVCAYVFSDTCERLQTSQLQVWNQLNNTSERA